MRDFLRYIFSRECISDDPWPVTLLVMVALGWILYFVFF
jgi:hypothetical protein